MTKTNFEVVTNLEEPILTCSIKREQITQKLRKVRGRYFVYILKNIDEVIYVGRSYNLACRLMWHKYRKDFNHVLIAEYSSYHECRKAEKVITKLLQPLENKLWIMYGIK